MTTRVASQAKRRDVSAGTSSACFACARWYSVSRAAASACMSTAPTSGASRPRMTTIAVFVLHSRHAEQTLSRVEDQIHALPPHPAVYPPSTGSETPVTKLASSLAR